MEKVINQSDLYENYVRNRPIYSWRHFGLYNDNLIEMIPAHWLKFNPVNDVVFFFAAVFNLFLTAHGLYVIVSLIVSILCWKSRNSINSLLLNLLCCDLIMTGKNFLLIFNSMYRGPALGEIGIRIDGLLGVLSNLGSIMSMVAIFAEAHSTIVLRSGIKLPGVSVIILGIWFVACYFSIVPFFGVVGIQFKADGLLTSGTFDYWQTNFGNRIFTMALMAIRFLLPLGFFRNTYKDMRTHVSDCGKKPREIYNEEQKINYIVKKISNFEGQLTNMENKVAVIEQNIATAKQNVVDSEQVAWIKWQTDRLEQIIANVQLEVLMVNKQIEELKEKIEEKEKQYGALTVKLVNVWLVTSIPYEIISVLEVLGFKNYISPELFAIATQWSQLKSWVNSIVIRMNHPEIK